MTDVTNMRTGGLIVYDLPAKKAVEAAYRQFVLNDWNWWQSPTKALPTEEGRWHWFCGDYSARKDNFGEGETNE